MKRRTLIRFALAGAAMALAAACQPKAEESAVFVPVPITPFMGETVLGDKAAPVEIIEYASTTCGHCKAFHDEFLPGLKSGYIDTGKAKLVYRVLPTQPGALAMAGAAIARCAGEDKFFDVIDDLFAEQNNLLASGNEAAARAALEKLGARHGLTPDVVKTCIQSQEISDLIIKGVEESPDFVRSTPTLIVGGKHVEDYSLPSLAAAIEAELAAAPGPAPGE